MRERSTVSPRASAIRSTQSSMAESIPRPSRSIFRKPASAHESLSHWQSCRPSIAAGTTGTSSTSGRDEITIPPGCWERWRGSPAISLQSQPSARQRRDASFVFESGSAASSSSTRRGSPFVTRASRSSSANGQAERLADVADRPAGVVRGERRHERRVLAPVALGHLHDQPLADVAREVEVDVGDGSELVVEEAAEREAGGDGIDVREPGEVADDRAHRGAAASARGQGVSRCARAAQVERDLPRQLEHLEVEEEEAGQLEVGDEPQLLLQALAGSPLVAVRAGVALGERALADAAQLRVGRLLAVGEVGIAVAELLGQVELEPSGELDRAGDGGARRRGSARPSRRRRTEDALAVAAPLALGAVQRRAMADGDERVLEHGAATGCASARRRWPPSPRRASRRGRAARRCGGRRRARTGAGARRRSARGRTRRRAGRRRSDRGRRGRGGRSRTGRRGRRCARRAPPAAAPARAGRPRARA